MTPSFGRLPAVDVRDLNHLLRSARPQPFAVPLDKLPKSKHYQRGTLLDQGGTSCCVEFSLEAKLRGAPVKVGQSRLPERFSIYDQAILLDEFTTNDSDPSRQYGTSVRAGCKALLAKGMISEYKWVFSVDEILQWILGGYGGLVLGIDWYTGMNDPGSEGIIRMVGTHVGGHAIYAYGADQTKEVLTLQNSWGAAWGGWEQHGQRVNPGCARLPLGDLKRLLDGNGEACAITETPYSRRRVVS